MAKPSATAKAGPCSTKPLACTGARVGQRPQRVPDSTLPWSRRVNAPATGSAWAWPPQRRIRSTPGSAEAEPGGRRLEDRGRTTALSSVFCPLSSVFCPLPSPPRAVVADRLEHAVRQPGASLFPVGRQVRFAAPAGISDVQNEGQSIVREDRQVRVRASQVQDHHGLARLAEVASLEVVEQG